MCIVLFAFSNVIYNNRISGRPFPLPDSNPRLPIVHCYSLRHFSHSLLLLLVQHLPVFFISLRLRTNTTTILVQHSHTTNHKQQHTATQSISLNHVQSFLSHSKQLPLPYQYLHRIFTPQLPLLNLIKLLRPHPNQHPIPTHILILPQLQCKFQPHPFPTHQFITDSICMSDTHTGCVGG